MVDGESKRGGSEPEFRPPENVLEMCLAGGDLDTAGRYRRSSASSPVIDGIEISPDDMPDSMANRFHKLYYGRPAEILPTLGVYDMIVIGDRLWSYGTDPVLPLIRLCFEHCAQVVAAYFPIPAPEEQVRNHCCDSCAICCLKDFFPVAFSSSFLGCGQGKKYCLLLIAKKDYLERRLTMYLEEAQEVLGYAGRRSLADGYGFSKGDVYRVDLQPFARYLADEDYGRYFLDPYFHEHYRLIAYLSGMFYDGTIFDVGTNKGYSALALAYNPTNRIISYDLLDCKALHDRNDLNTIEFCIGDVLEDPRLGEAQLVVLDTDHDGEFEVKFYNHLKNIGYSGLLFLDDIHLNPQMEKFWKSIKEPKADLTHLGHWIGSGLVDFGAGAVPALS